MLASFFYQGEPPEPETLLDMAREALVAASDSSNEFDDDTCKAMVDGLVRAWMAARAHAHRDDEEDWEEPTHETAAEAEAAFRKVSLAVYVARVRQAYPEYDPSDDGVLWWPEGMAYRKGWPKAFIEAVARTLGEIDGDRSVAMFKYMQQRKAAAGGEA